MYAEFNRTLIQKFNQFVEETVAARYSSDTVQSIGTTLEIIDFEDKDYDDLGCVTVGAAWKFRAPQDGYYSVRCIVGFASEAYEDDNRVYLSLFKDGTELTMLNHYKCDQDNTRDIYLNGMEIVHLDQGSYIDIRAISNRTAGDSATVATAKYKNITIARLR